MVVIFSMVLGYASQAAWAEGQVARRQDHQQERIANGINSGQLTPGETIRLEKGEKRIENTREKALADGKMTRGEKARLNKMQNKESRKIYRAKHNDRKL